MASPLPYLRMIFEGTCDTISELGLIKLSFRVLHPGISARHTVDILRGLPEGSRLSPTLFGIFVAHLVHELRAKFPERLFTLDINRQTHTPFDLDLQRISGLEVYSMLMT